MAAQTGVRGYADWKPGEEARYWVACTNRVLREYRDYWPLTVRQLFYRLVGVYEYEKTEGAYNRLSQMLSRARRAGMIEWEAIRDGGQGKRLPASFFDSAEDFNATVRATARQLKLNRQQGQAQVIELWCEAGGMTPILQGIAAPYSAQVNSGGGYDSVTAKHELATRVMERAREGQKTLILHVGDFDGSGENMCKVLRDDTGAMVLTQVVASIARCYHQKGDDADGWKHLDWNRVGPIIEAAGNGGMSDADSRYLGGLAWGYLKVERVALTGQQVVERQVITAPPKRSDSRSAGFIEDNWEVVEALGTEDISAQLEALTPPELEALIREELEAHMDLDRYGEVLDEEERVRRELLEKLG